MQSSFITLQSRNNSQVRRNVMSQGARWASPDSEKSEPRIIDSRNNSNQIDGSGSAVNSRPAIVNNSNQPMQMNGVPPLGMKSLSLDIDPVILKKI